MEISAEKTKLMMNKTSGINKEINVNRQKLETVTSFKYLDSVVSDDTLQDSADDNSIDKVEISLERQTNFCQFQGRMMRSLVKSIFLYACESWTLTAEPQKRIRVIEMMC